MRSFVKNFGVNIVDKLFFIFCVPQLNETESNWPKEEGVNPVTTHSELTTALPVDLDASGEEDRGTAIKSEPESISATEEEKANMADQENDPEISSLYAHLDGEPPQAIVTTLGQEAIYVEPHIMAVLPVFLGRSCDSPYEFLHEFCKICKALKRPAGSSEDDYRLKALPFALKGEANTWFKRLPPNCIRTWSDFKMMFLDQFFPAARTSALRDKIRGVTQGYDETLSQYWSRYMGLLDACPNHHMLEVEIYSIFYERMNAESKDLVNSSSGGSFSKLRVSEAKRIMERLLYAKRAYDNPRTLPSRRGMANAAAVGNNDQLESRIDKLERALLSAIEKSKPQVPPVNATTVTAQEDHYPNTTGLWNSNRNWNPEKQEDTPWREHLDFRWGEGNSNQPNPPQNAYDGPPAQDSQPNWSGRNQHNPHPPNPYQNTTYVPQYQMGNQNYQSHSPQHCQTHPCPNPNQHHHPNQFSQYPSHQNQPNYPYNQNHPIYQSHPNGQYNSHHQQNPYLHHLNPNHSQPHNSNQFGQYPSHQNQPNYTYHPYPNTQYNPHHQQNPNHFLHQNKSGRSMEEMMGEMLAYQQTMRSEFQSNNEVVQGMQNAQKEHKENMDMLNKQLSYLASSMNEICGNAERLPVTVHIPDKANVSKVTLWSGTSYKEPERKESFGESSKTKDKGDILTKRSGPDETEPVAEPQINQGPEESSRETTKEPDEEVKEEKSFPYCFVKKRKEGEPVDYMSIFGKLEVTIPCIQAVKLPPFGTNIKVYIVGSTREEEKIVIEGNTPTMVLKKLPPKRSDPRWCDLTSSQTLTDQDIEETICQKSRFARATGAHQLAEKKAERKQGLKRASRRIIGRRIEKKKGPNKVHDLVEISSEEDKTPCNKKKSKDTDTGQEDSGPPTKPGEDPKHATTKSETPAVAGHPSSTLTIQEGGSPTKPGENPTATFAQPVQEANIDNPLAIPAAQKETPVPETDLQENQDKEGKCNQERKRKGNGAAKQKKETKKPRVVLSAIIIKKLGQVPKLIGSKVPSNHHLRPMEKRKIKGTFKNHKKKSDTPDVYQQRNPRRKLHKAPDQRGSRGEDDRPYQLTS